MWIFVGFYIPVKSKYLCNTPEQKQWKWIPLIVEKLVLKRMQNKEGYWVRSREPGVPLCGV